MIKEDTMPTIIDAAIPVSEVFFQKSKNRIAGRLAEAAMANAQPTRKETLTPLNAIPNIIAKIPTANAAIFPALTLLLSFRFF